ncbi:MAG TPA: hypothetical protein VI874_01670 [Candidatus Norongarragalinales archaeon]|nr:hypothetical protein [Candidatus Norongarragalinales archaeon]
MADLPAPRKAKTLNPEEEEAFFRDRLHAAFLYHYLLTQKPPTSVRTPRGGLAGWIRTDLNRLHGGRGSSDLADASRIYFEEVHGAGPQKPDA